MAQMLAKPFAESEPVDDDLPMAIPVRAANVADAAEVVRLGPLMFASMGLDPEGPWRAVAEARVADGLADGTVVAFVVDRDDEPGRLAANASGTVARRLPGPLNPTG